MLKNTKSIMTIIGFYLSIIIFCSAMIVIGISIKNLFHDDNIAQIPVQVIVALLSGAMGGAFTLLGVDKTFNKQKEMNFVQVFPLKIYYLDELIEKLNELKKQLNEKNAPFLVVKEQAIANLITDSIEVDGYIYFKVRDAHNQFSLLIREMFFNKEKCLFNRNEHSEWIQLEGKENEISIKILNLNKIIDDLNGIMNDYRETFINDYNKNIEGTIYKKIN